MEISTFSNSKILIIRKLTQAITVVGGSLFPIVGSGGLCHWSGQERPIRPAWNGMTEVNTAQVSSCFSTVRNVHPTWRVMRSVWWEELDDFSGFLSTMPYCTLRVWSLPCVSRRSWPSGIISLFKNERRSFCEARFGAVPWIGPLLSVARKFRRLPAASEWQVAQFIKKEFDKHHWLN